MRKIEMLEEWGNVPVLPTWNWESICFLYCNQWRHRFVFLFCFVLFCFVFKFAFVFVSVSVSVFFFFLVFFGGMGGIEEKMRFHGWGQRSKNLPKTVDFLIIFSSDGSGQGGRAFEGGYPMLPLGAATAFNVDYWLEKKKWNQLVRTVAGSPKRPRYLRRKYTQEDRKNPMVSLISYICVESGRVRKVKWVKKSKSAKS